MILQRREFANYLRKNSSVKGDATSSEIHGACSAKLEQCEWPSNASWRRHSRITSSTKSPLRSGLPPDECLLLVRCGEVSLRKRDFRNLEFPKWRLVLSIFIHVSSAANFPRISKATTGVPNRDTIGEQKCAAAQTIAKASRERSDPPSRELRSDRP